MNPSRITLPQVLSAVLLLAGGCQQNSRGDDESYVKGLRVLAIKAEPPELPSGQPTVFSALVVDTLGRSPNIDWADCEEAPPDGEQINNDCILNPSAPYLKGFGNGMSAMFTVPTLDASMVGTPDFSGGVYLPIRATITADTDSQIAIYRLRVGMGSLGNMPNKNPKLTGIYQVMTGAGNGSDGIGDMGPPDGGSFSSGTDLLTQLDPMNPPVVHMGDKIQLRALFAPGSAESYNTMTRGGGGFGNRDGGMGGGMDDGGMGGTTDGGTRIRMTTERLDVSYFSTAGTLRGVFGMGMMGGPMMGGPMMGGGNNNNDVTLTIDNNLPASGGTIDIWAVGRDTRGGTDFVHASVVFQ